MRKGETVSSRQPLEVRVVSDLPAAALEYLEEAVAGAVREGRPAHVALSGGTTPRALFAKLGAGEAGDLDVAALELWWSDERVVPPDSAESNYGTARRLWLDVAAERPAAVHPWPVEVDPVSAARLYADELGRHIPGATPPQLDLVFLGVGPEGHTASLFPHSPALDAEGWTTAVYAPAAPPHRLTMTLPLINAARRVVFLVEGAAKRGIVRRWLSLPAPTPDLPASLVVPAAPAVLVLDPAAAGDAAGGGAVSGPDASTPAT
jgi:6-phosphogluconolactonase